MTMRALMEREKLEKIWGMGGIGKRVVLQLQTTTKIQKYNVIFLPTHPFHKLSPEPSLSFPSWYQLGLENGLLLKCNWCVYI